MNSSTGILTIDLGAIQSNWMYVRSSLKNDSECAAVVKANAYGIGAAEVAKALSDVGCKTFYLATLEEASELRHLLPADVALYVLGGARQGSEVAYVDFNLIPVLYSLDAFNQWLSFCNSINKALPCAIKIDTGMTRFGLSESDFDAILAETKLSFFNPILLMSHLACADEFEHPLNKMQLNKFKHLIGKAKKYFPNIKTSLANSSGTFLGDEYQFDMVRVGAALYGINPQPSRPNPLKQTIDLKLPVLQIRTIESTVDVGYGATVSVDVGQRLAVVAGGYADGINRTLGARPKGIIDGEQVHAVGRISMDSFIFDISSSSCADPEYIEVINAERTVDKISMENKSLGYEVLTSLGWRYKRQYLFADN
jgi:alanine racemase